MPRIALAAALALTSCISVEVQQASPRGDGTPSLTLGTRVALFSVDAADPEGGASSEVLEEGVDYVVRVSGTYSIWAAHHAARPCRGEPEDHAQFPSERRSGPVAMDAAWRFAVPTSSPQLCDLPDASSYPGWQSPRSGWRYRLRASDPWTLAPALAAYEPSHVYQYHLRGRGERLRVAAVDGSVTSDNYGRLQIEVFRAEP